MCREDTWMGMWWRRWFMNRREASSTYFHTNTRCTAEASAWSSFSVFLCCIKSQVLRTGLILQKGKNMSSGTQILSCRDSFRHECKMHHSIFWISGGGWAVWADISPNSSNLSLHHPVISATLCMMFFTYRFYFIFFLKTGWSEFSLKLDESVPQLLQWLLGQTSKSSATFTFLLFLIALQYFWQDYFYRNFNDLLFGNSYLKGYALFSMETKFIWFRRV